MTFNQNELFFAAVTMTANTTSSWVALNGTGHNYDGIAARLLIQDGAVSVAGTLDVLIELSRDGGTTVHGSLDGLFRDVTTATTGVGSGNEQTVRIPIRDFNAVRLKIGGTGGSTPATGTWPATLSVKVTAGLTLANKH